jgi:ketosteroid isomerase-like protein
MAMDIQTLLDLEEIRQLRYSFAWNLETSNPDALADLFTEDGVIDVGPWGVMNGQAKIRKGYGRAYRDAPQFTAIHAVTNPRIFVTGDTAKGVWYLLDCSLRAKEQRPIEIVGLYDEDYRRENGDWKIAKLKLKFLWASHIGQITPETPMTLPPYLLAAAERG